MKIVKFKVCAILTTFLAPQLALGQDIPVSATPETEFARVLGTDRAVSGIALQTTLGTLLAANGGKLPCDVAGAEAKTERRFVTKPVDSQNGMWVEEWRVTICNRMYVQKLQVTLNLAAPPQNRLRIQPLGEPTLAQN